MSSQNCSTSTRKQVSKPNKGQVVSPAIPEKYHHIQHLEEQPGSKILQTLESLKSKDISRDDRNKTEVNKKIRSVVSQKRNEIKIEEEESQMTGFDKRTFDSNRDDHLGLDFVSSYLPQKRRKIEELQSNDRNSKSPELNKKILEQDLKTINEEFYYDNERHEIPSVKTQDSTLEIDPKVRMEVEHQNLSSLNNDNLTVSDYNSSPENDKIAIGSKYQAVLPVFDLNSNKRSHIKKSLKTVWNPQTVSSERIPEYCLEISDVIGQPVTNQEKVIKCLLKFNMDFEATIENIKNNKSYFKTFFSACQRMLRNRRGL